MSGLFFKLELNNYLENVMLQKKMNLVKETIVCNKCGNKDEIFHNSEDDTLKDFTTYDLCNDCIKKIRRRK